MHRLSLKSLYQMAALGLLLGRATQHLNPHYVLPGLTTPREPLKAPKRRDTKAKAKPRTKPYPKQLGRRDTRRRRA